MGVSIDVLTEEQKKYLASWESGTVIGMSNADCGITNCLVVHNSVIRNS